MSSSGAIAYIALVTVAIMFKADPLTTSSLPPPWQVIEINSALKINSVADIRKEIQKTEPIKVEPPKSVPPITTEKPKIVATKTLKSATNVVEKNLSPKSATETPAAMPLSKKETISIEKIAALIPTANKLALPGLNGGPGQTKVTASSGPLKGTMPSSKPGVEGQSGKQAAFVDLKNLSGKLGPVLANEGLGGINVNFRSSPGGGGAPQGSASKNYNLGGP